MTLVNTEGLYKQNWLQRSLKASVRLTCKFLSSNSCQAPHAWQATVEKTPWAVSLDVEGNIKLEEAIVMILVKSRRQWWSSLASRWLGRYVITLIIIRQRILHPTHTLRRAACWSHMWGSLIMTKYRSTAIWIQCNWLESPAHSLCKTYRLAALQYLY